MSIREEIQDIVWARLTGELQPEEEKKFQLWLAENSEHRKEYEVLGSIRCAIRWGGERERIAREEGWQKVVKKYQKRRNIRLFSMAAIAASVVLAVGMFLLFKTSEEVVPMASNESIWEKAEVTLILSSGDSIHVKETGVSDIQEEGSIIHTDSEGVHYLKGKENGENKFAYNELIVPKCGEYQLSLSDGSQVKLNASSKLRYPVNFAEDCREVYLEGEACFEVAKDSLRPFVVRTAHSSVQVLGTLFNVSSYEQEENTIITLVNGKVQVGVNESLSVLRPNEQLVLNHESLEIDVKSVVAEDYVAWTRGLFRFDRMPLRQLVPKLERWYDISCEFKDSIVGDICVTGGFWKYDDIRLILKVIGEIANVDFKMVNRNVIINKK